MHAVGVGQSHEVGPVAGHVFAVRLVLEQTIDQLLVGVGRVILEERSISATLGGSPVRSKVTRRISVRLSASCFGCSPSCSSRAITYGSIMPCRQAPVLHFGVGYVRVEQTTRTRRISLRPESTV